MKKLIFVLLVVLVAACSQRDEVKPPPVPLQGGDFHYVMPNETPIYEPRVSANGSDCTDAIHYKPKVVGRTYVIPSNPWLGSIVNCEVRPYKKYDLPALNPAKSQWNNTIVVKITNKGNSTVKICVGANCTPGSNSAAIIPPTGNYYITLPVQQGGCTFTQPVISFQYTYYLYHCGFNCGVAPAPVAKNTILELDVYSVTNNHYFDSVIGSDLNEVIAYWLTCTNCPTYPGMP